MHCSSLGRITSVVCCAAGKSHDAACPHRHSFEGLPIRDPKENFALSYKGVEVMLITWRYDTLGKKMLLRLAE